jgi:di/tricarboxylate transporter
VPNLSEALKYALVAGAVAGGGLTVIANAPNPAGFAILRPCFGKDGISPAGLLAFALPPTLVAMACFWFL